MWGHNRGAQPGDGYPGAKRDSDEGVGKSAPEQRRDGGAKAQKCVGPVVKKSH
jgi:hypothetical protein